MRNIDDFDRVVDRHGTYCTQWDYVADRFGHADLLPFTISDMDFETAPCIRQTLATRLEHGVFGYSRWNHGDFKGVVSDWFARRYGAELDPETLVYGPSVIYVIAQLVSLWSAPGEGVLVHLPPMTPSAICWPPTTGCCCLARLKKSRGVAESTGNVSSNRQPHRLPDFASVQPSQPHRPGLDAR